MSQTSDACVGRDDEVGKVLVKPLLASSKRGVKITKSSK